MSAQVKVVELASKETRELTEFISGTTYADLPPAVIGESKKNILDFLAVVIGAAHLPATEVILGYIRDAGGTPQATVPVSGERTNPVNVALALGVMGHVLDFDDTHLPTILHGTTPVMSSVLPLTEWLGRSGEELLSAYATGFEVAARVALAMHPAHYDAGWHVTATAGTLGAAAASAQLLKLGPDQTASALGLAATQAAGEREHFGTMAKAFGVAKAAANGTLAGQLAQRGFDAAPDSLQGRRGLFAVMAAHVQPDRLSAGLGQSWELEHSGLKPYPCGIVTHASVDAALRIRNQADLRPADIAGIHMRVHPLVLELTNKQSPRTGLESKFSVAFLVALAICRGRVDPFSIVDSSTGDSDIRQVAEVVQLEADQSLSEGEAYAAVHLTDGRTLREHIPIATGMPGNPMTDEQRLAKARALIEPILGPGACEALIAFVDGIETAESVGPLIRAATGSRP